MTLDHIAVMQLINRYGVAVDSKRWDFFDQVFTDDVVADYGAPVIFTGLENFKKGAADAWGTFDASQHSMSNTVFDRRGDTGRSITYGNWYIIRRDAIGGELWEGRGWYHDEWVLLDRGWRIRRRICRVMAWSGNPLVSNAAFKERTPDLAGTKTYSISDAVAEGLFSFFET